MGSNLKNILLSLSICGLGFFNYAITKLISELNIHSVVFLLILNAWILLTSVLITILVIFMLIKVATAMTELREQYPNENINLSSMYIWLLLLFAFTFPNALGKRDKILQKHNAFRPFISYQMYRGIVLVCAFCGVVSGGLFVYAKVGDKPKPSAYNSCFYLAQSSNNCTYKTAMPLAAFDKDQDSLIDALEEKVYHTNPAELDSDNDNIPDGIEVNDRPLTELASKDDSDSDTLPNSLEEQLSLRTDASDSDNDGYTDNIEIINGYYPLGPQKNDPKYSSTSSWVKDNDFTF